MKHLAFVFTLICQSLISAGQTFSAESKLPPIEMDGFHSIILTPDIFKHTRPDLSDFRIYDEKNQEVPYLLKQVVPEYYTTQFREYKILDKKQSRGHDTRMVLHNPDRNPINNISLVIKNAEITKQASLLGSDDRKNWYALKQSFQLYSINNDNGVSTTKVVHFPLSNYLYYSLEIEDSTTAPLNILKAGYYEVSQEKGSYTEVSSLKINRLDSTKQKMTYVRIVFDSARLVDKLEFSMKGQPYFLRNAKLYQPEIRTTKKGSKEKYYSIVQTFELSSTHPAVLDLPGMKTPELLIVIENEDNPPLDGMSAKVYQLNRFAIAWLKKGTAYKLQMGNEQLTAPSYDIAYFKDSIPNQAPVIAAGQILVKKSNAADISTSIFNSKNFIWAAIVAVIILLGSMTIKMTREIGKKN